MKPRRSDLAARVAHLGERSGYAAGADASLLAAVFDVAAGFRDDLDAYARLPDIFERRVAELLERREGKPTARLVAVSE